MVVPSIGGSIYAHSEVLSEKGSPGSGELTTSAAQLVRAMAVKAR